MTKFYTKMSIKHAVLSLLLLAFIFCTSCIPSNKQIGTGFATDDFQLTAKKVSFNIPVSLAVPDSIQSYSTTTMVVGEINDPFYGTAKAGSVTFIVPSSDTCFLGFDPQLINAYALLMIDSTYTSLGTPDGLAQNFSLHRLNSEIDTSKMFNTSFSAEDIDPNPINVGSSVFYGGDSIKMMISDDYARELLRTSQEEFDSTELFVKRMKGLYLSVTSDDNSGGRLNYLPVSTSYIRVNYKLTDPGQGFLDHDTSQIFVLGYYSAINTLSNESAHLANATPSDELYVECWNGVKPKISGESLRWILQSWAENSGYDPQRVIIARAYLTFPYEMPADYKVVDQYPDILYPCYVESHTDSLKFFYPLSEIYSNTFIGEISRSQSKYTCDITTYAQHVISSEEALDSSSDLWIMPIFKLVDSTNDAVYYNFDTINYSKATLNGPTAARKPTLSIWYSVINY